VIAIDATCYVALPLIPVDDGLAPGEAVGCLSANAAVKRTEVPLGKTRLRRQPSKAEWEGVGEAGAAMLRS
jgi:hypothetical protein